MSKRSDTARSPLGLVVLALLFERPMHPYRMQKLIGERGKDEVVNVRSRNSIQQTVDRLEREGMITVGGTEQEGNYPPRTVYALTEAGREHLVRSLRKLLAFPAREFPTFPAALSFMAILPMATAADLLRQRRERLSESLAAKAASTGEAIESLLPRIFLIEDDYTITMRRAEIGWLDRTVEAIDSGDLAWEPQRLLEWAHGDEAEEP